MGLLPVPTSRHIVDPAHDCLLSHGPQDKHPLTLMPQPTIAPVTGAPQGSFVHLRLGSCGSRWLSPTALPLVIVIRLSATDNSLEQG